MKLLQKIASWFSDEPKQVEVVIQPKPVVAEAPVPAPTRTVPRPKKPSVKLDAPAKKPRIYNENKPKKK